MMLRSPLQPLLRSPISLITDAIRRAFPWSSLFTNNTPGFRVNVEEALRLNRQALGPELVSNGSFDTDTAWTKGAGWAIASGVATKTAGVQSFLDTLSPSSFVAGGAYRLSISCTRSAGSLYVYIRGVLALQFTAGVNSSGGTITVCVPAGSSSVNGLRIEGDASFVGSVDNVSVREIDLSKCVAFQDSAGTLPVVSMEQPLGLILDKKLGVPVLGSQLVTNGGFDADTAWTKGTGWAIGSGVATKTAGTASTLTPSTAIVPTVGRWYVVEYTITRTAGSLAVSIGAGTGAAKTASGTYREILCASTTGNLTFSADATFAGTVDSVSVRELPGNHFVQPSNTASRPIVSRRVNLLIGTATLATQNVTTLAASHVLTLSGTGSVTLSGTATGTYSAGTHTITTTAGTLTVTVSGSVTNADLRLSIDSALPYQRVTSSTDYDESGFPAYARFDGLDDWLETGGTVDMSSTDAVTVLAGVTKLSDASASVVVESSVDSASNNGAILLLAPGGTGLTTYLYRSRGTAFSQGSIQPFPAPDKAVITGLSKISTDFLQGRRNGVIGFTVSTDQGTGNYGNHKFYMGRRGGVSLPFNGRIYGVTVVGKLLTDSQLAAAEQAERQMGRLY